MPVKSPLAAGLAAVAAAAQGAAIAVSVAAVAACSASNANDGRSNRQAATRRFSIRQSQFAAADADVRFHDGWFRDQFRCNKASFDRICLLIEEHWLTVNDPIGHNASFFVRDRVAVTLFYLMHAGSVVEGAKSFGMSKSSAVRYIRQVIEVILVCLWPRFVRLPATVEQWRVISDGFEEICGFPHCCFAIDGCLFEIERPYNFEGWYCRKGYPAINAQVVVDHRARILSFDLRPGSANDKAVFNYSRFGSDIKNSLPPGKYGVGDAGYTLSDKLMIPFPITESMPPDQSQFNYMHSRTRITIERAFGMIKNRFRIFKVPLNQKKFEQSGESETSQMAKVIQACFVLHNVLIEFGDEDVNDDAECDSTLDESDLPREPNTESMEQSALQIRNNIMRYLMETR